MLFDNNSFFGGKMKIKAVLIGACGKMGQMIASSFLKRGEISVDFPVEFSAHSAMGFDYGEFSGFGKNDVKIISLEEVCGKEFDVIVDFSSPESFRKALEMAVIAGKPFVSGTTGLGEGDFKLLEKAGEKIAVIHSPNMSVGVNILFSVMEKIGAATADFDAEIIEMHHKHKKDAPSGTALKLGEIIAKSRGCDLKSVALYGREGATGERVDGSICFHSLRGGDVAGDHTVIFAGNGERIEITHKAHSRSLFVDGVVMAAGWIYEKKPGIYSMKDVLGL